jgi:membrane associated rhomboid family serine protease
MTDDSQRGRVQMTDRNAAPLNPLPPVVWLLALPLIGFEIVFQAGASGLAGGADAIGWRLDAMQRLAFVPDYFRQTLGQGLWRPDSALRLLSYPLVHADILHAMFVVVMLLALGKFVGEVFRAWAVLAVVLVATLTGAVVYGAVPGMEAALVGGYPPVFGLIGAFTYILWTRAGMVGASRVRAFRLIGFLLVMQAAFGLLFGGSPVWIADVAGFAAGFLLSFAVSPGGWARVRAMLRAR